MAKILCDVDSCAYNSQRLCVAEEIKVDNDPKVKREATSCKQTECSTFTLK